MDKLEKRTQLIRLRIESLERRKLVLHPHEKWPTVKSVRRYQERKSISTPPEGPSPRSLAASRREDHNAIDRSPSSKSKDTNTTATKLPSFPFPITKAKNSTSFPQFSNLPPELRLQIWEFAFLLPKFVEAQFCTQFYEPAFVNCVPRSVLFSVCRESRAIALVSPPDHNFLSALTLTSSRPYHNRFLPARPPSREQKPWPNKTIHFNPERDTVFFRSLNLPSGDPRSFLPGLSGMETIQHLAIPLEQKGLPSRWEWNRILGSMKALKTLTFMTGSKEKSWKGNQRDVELRDVEQWYVDGRSRDIVCRGSGKTVDVRDVSTLMMNSPYTKFITGHVPRTICQDRVVNVRVVAWKRGGRS